MQKILVRVYSWENSKLYSAEFGVERGEKVIVATEFANELGVAEEVDIKTDEQPESKILRVATKRDTEVHEKNEKTKDELHEICREEIKKLGLEMKMVDIRISLDGIQMVLAFTAEGRVDFRELVRNLAKKIKKNVRMKQIGSRDEARKLGGYGICGRELCCVRFGGNIPSITTEMARSQQISNRGADRISGLCGRLMCCLAYEAGQYKEMLSGMPEMHSSVKAKEGKGTVVEINALTGQVKVRLDGGEYIIIKKEDIQ